MSARARRGATAAGLLLFACATATVPIRSEHLGYSGCDREQRRAIARAFDRAALLGETAAAAIATPENHARARADAWPQYQWWFGDYSRERYEVVRDVLESTLGEFDHAYQMRCGSESRNCPLEPSPPDPSADPAESPEDYGPDYEADWGPGRAWKVFAYANSDIRSLQVCADFFEEDASERGAILFHELTHVVRDTEDYAYRERTVLNLAILRPDRAVRNAPSYQGFATSVASGRVPVDDDIPDDD